MSTCFTIGKSLCQPSAQPPTPPQLPMPIQLAGHSQCMTSLSWCQHQSPRWLICKLHCSFSNRSHWQLHFKHCYTCCQQLGSRSPLHRHQCLSGCSASQQQAVCTFCAPTAAACTTSAPATSCYRQLRSLSNLCTLFRWCLGTPLDPGGVQQLNSSRQSLHSTAKASFGVPSTCHWGFGDSADSQHINWLSSRQVSASDSFRPLPQGLQLLLLA